MAHYRKKGSATTTVQCGGLFYNECGQLRFHRSATFGVNAARDLQVTVSIRRIGIATWCDTENAPVIPQVVFQELNQAPLMFLQWNAAFSLHVCMCEIDSFLGPETTPCCFSSPGQIRPESPRVRSTWRSLWARASCYPVRWPATPSSMSPSPGPSTDSSSPRETATSSWWAGWATAVIHPENVRMDSWHLFPPRSASSLPLD